MRDRVIGVDPERIKVDRLNADRASVIENDFSKIIEEQVAAGLLRVT